MRYANRHLLYFAFLRIMERMEYEIVRTPTNGRCGFALMCTGTKSVILGCLVYNVTIRQTAYDFPLAFVSNCIPISFQETLVERGNIFLPRVGAPCTAG